MSITRTLGPLLLAVFALLVVSYGRGVGDGMHVGSCGGQIAGTAAM